MEDSQAAFVNMLMDRLQALEGRVQEMQVEMHTTKTTTSSLAGSIHLQHDLTKFSDGWWLRPGFSKLPDTIRNSSWQMGVAVPLDNLHLDAIAFHGRVQIQVDKEAGRGNVINLGEQDSDPTTVRALLAAINAWCLRPCGTETNYAKYLDNSCGPPSLLGASWVGYDLEAHRDVLELKLA